MVTKNVKKTKTKRSASSVSEQAHKQRQLLLRIKIAKCQNRIQLHEGAQR